MSLAMDNLKWGAEIYPTSCVKIFSFYLRQIVSGCHFYVLVTMIS
jgi:hypothetical protein